MNRALLAALSGLLATTPLLAQARGSAALRGRLAERAAQTREIVYFLQQPETHAFDLYHDYTEAREGMDRYLNVVRAGSTVSKPSAVLLDTGESLETKILKGDEITRAQVDIGEPVKPETELVLIRFPAGKKGQTTSVSGSRRPTPTRRDTGSRAMS